MSWFFAVCQEHKSPPMIDGFQSFGQSSIRLTDRQPKCGVASNPNFAKNTIRRLADGDFLKQTRLNLGLSFAAIPWPDGEPNGNGF